jgi:ubiquinone/menaquinone biosynthesis C-methylase UbiE/DNA-binding transcriptional ArsR family regulator
MIRTEAQPDAMVGWMASLADPTRIRLMRLLERHELGVAELCDILQMPQSTVSRHLKLLSDQGWLASRRQGTTNLYHMILDELDDAARRLWLLTREQTDGWASWHQDQLRAIQRLRERQQGSQRFFAGAAAAWDAMREELYGRGFIAATVAAMLPSTWVVADLGCGTGLLAASIAPHVRRVIGIDNSPEMLAAARQRVGDAGNVDLREGDVAAPPIEDASCDAAMLVLVLTYLPDAAAALTRARRILKPGGRLVVVDLLTHDRDDFRRQMGQQSMGFSLDDMTTLLHRAGLSQITVRSLPPEPNVKGPALLLASATHAH